MKKIIFILLICLVIIEGIFIVIQELKLSDYRNMVERKNSTILSDTIYDILYVQNTLDKCISTNSIETRELDKIYDIYNNFTDNKQIVSDLYNAGQITNKKYFKERYILINRVSEYIDDIKADIDKGKELKNIKPYIELQNINKIFIDILLEKNLIIYDNINLVYDRNLDIDYPSCVKINSFVFDIYYDFIHGVGELDYIK